VVGLPRAAASSADPLLTMALSTPSEPGADSEPPRAGDGGGRGKDRDWARLLVAFYRTHSVTRRALSSVIMRGSFTYVLSWYQPVADMVLAAESASSWKSSKASDKVSSKVVCASLPADRDGLGLASDPVEIPA